jgi:hypothetical protein
MLFCQIGSDSVGSENKELKKFRMFKANLHKKIIYQIANGKNGYARAGVNLRQVTLN